MSKEIDEPIYPMPIHPKQAAAYGLTVAKNSKSKLYAVMDHICEADILIAAFSTKALAEKWIKVHKDDLYGPGVRSKRYEGLDIEEVDLDPIP